MMGRLGVSTIVLALALGGYGLRRKRKLLAVINGSRVDLHYGGDRGIVELAVGTAPAPCE